MAGRTVLFRTPDPTYPGPSSFPVGTVLSDVLIATEHLPVRFPVERFHPFRHGSRYVIAVRVTVTAHALSLHGSGSGDADFTLYTAVLPPSGLPMVLRYQGQEYPGVLLPG